MGIPEDPAEQKQWMLDLLINHYGLRGHVIHQDDQPNLIDLPKAEEPQKAPRKPDAKILKANERLYDVISYLQRQYGLFREGTVKTDCPIHPWFGPTPDEDLWVYRGVFRIIARNHGYLAFTCSRESRCLLTQCPIHPSVPFGIQKFDPFDLLSILHSIQRGVRYPNRHGKMADYADELSKALGIETKKLRATKQKSHGGQGRSRGRRHVCNRNQLMIEITSTVPANEDDLRSFIERVMRLIFRTEPRYVYDQTRSSEEVWFHQSSHQTVRNLGRAARLWLYLWILQQQQGGRVKADPKAFAEVLGVTPRTVGLYRQILEKQDKINRNKEKGALGAKIETWTVKK